MFVSNLESIKIKLASPEEILSWSKGEVTKPETINYRTQRPEKDGLFCEKIFGPTKDYECFCGKYKKIRYKGIICDKCGVEVTKSSVRRERMGHIKLATPVSHIWFLKGMPSRIGMVLGLPIHKVEEVVYLTSYIITKVDENEKNNILESIEEEYKSKVKEIKKIVQNEKKRLIDVLQTNQKIEKKLEGEKKDLIKKLEKSKEEGLTIEKELEAALGLVMELEKAVESRKTEVLKKIEGIKKSIEDKKGKQNKLPDVLEKAVKNLDKARELEKAIEKKKKGLIEALDKVKKAAKQKEKNSKEVFDKVFKAIVEEKGITEALDAIELVELEVKKFMRDKARKEVAYIKPMQILTEICHIDLSKKYGECFEAGTGAEIIKEIFEGKNLEEEIEKIKEQLNNKKATEEKKNILKRLKLFKEMSQSGVRPEWMFIEVLPVLPPDLRPMVQLDGGRYASSDLNDLYRRVINRNNRLKYLLEINAPEVIVRNEKRMLQEAVDALIDNKMRKGTTTQASTGGRRLLKSLADMLAGKQGRFRQNLLGKRVDYSGRSVIVVGANLNLDQCGVPKKMALELFKPFVIKKLLERELSYNVRGATRLIEDEIDEVWAALEEVVKEKVVLLNRAPTLHRLGVQGFHPVLIEGDAIRLHPLVCTAFNADFDGDQMAIHLPLSEEAQKEAREKMLSSMNLLRPSTGDPIAIPTKDMVLGCYYLTSIVPGALGEGKVFGSPEEVKIAQDLKKIDLRALIKVRINGVFIETTAGRIIFNEELPEGFEFQNEVMDSKNVKKAINKIVDIYGSEAAITLDKIKNLGFEYATLSGITWGMGDLTIPVQKKEMIAEAEKKLKEIEKAYEGGMLTKKEKINKVIEIWKKVKNEIEKLVPKSISDKSPVYSIVNSGSRGSWSQPVQMAGMKGLVANPSGRIIELAIKNCFKEGFDVLEYFISTHGARKGTADTALRTSTSGYLTRRLVDVAHDVMINDDDCGETKGIKMKRSDSEEVNQDYIHKLFGRVCLEDIKDPETKDFIVKKGEYITLKAAQRIKELKEIEEVKVRSPLSCKCVRGVCKKCYGLDLGWKKEIDLGEAVGVIAAQVIGEPGTQLTMRTFHTGGVAGEADITRGLPRVEEVFERRTPKGEAEVCEKDGKVVEIIEDQKEKIKKIMILSDKPSKEAEKEEIKEYKVTQSSNVLVKKDDKVEKGQPLCEGSLDLKKLFRLKGEEEARNYIIKEIQRVYVSQGVAIHDKHIEIIVKQMFSRVRIEDSGDSFFSEDEIISKARMLEENERLEKEGSRPIKGEVIILGISKVALNTDSFLSAASFQETSKILIEASLRGEEDMLRGLKENVILGKLVPIGTGYVKNNKSK